MKYEWWTGKDMKGNARGLIELSQYLPRRRTSLKIHDVRVEIWTEHLPNMTQNRYSLRHFFFSFLGWGETESTWYVGH
jgi:hypothetical protein